MSFAAPITSAREVNGQEQPVGAATLEQGALVTSFGGYQPRTFALKLTPATTAGDSVKSAAVALKFDLATATNDGTKAAGGFDGKGNSLPAEMLPSELRFNDVKFELGAAKTGSANAVVAKGQEIRLPAGQFNRVYVLAAAADGDQTGVFEAGGAKTELKILDWGGFVGQWDDRQWSKADYKNDDYGQMTGLKPGFIKRADLAWYCSHHHDAAGKNVDYSYSYLFAYEMDLLVGAKTLKLPNNRNIRVLAVSVAQEGPKVVAARPLYDVLPVGTN